MNDRAAFIRRLVALASVLDGDLSSISKQELYWSALKHLTDEQFDAACNRLLRTSRFFPKPVDFIEDAHGDSDERAHAAWLVAWDEVSHTGAYRTPRFDDPAITAAVLELGGWVAFCRPTDDETWHRKRFMAAYASADKRRDVLPAILAGKQLMGEHDRINQRSTPLLAAKENDDVRDE